MDIQLYLNIFFVYVGSFTLLFSIILFYFIIVLIVLRIRVFFLNINDHDGFLLWKRLNVILIIGY